MRVFDVNIPFKIKNPNFNTDLKNMTKLGKCDNDSRYERWPLGKLKDRR